MDQIIEDTVLEMDPVAVIEGKPVQEMPEDLYIPPDALEVFLETFEGPLDLLLYLIKHQNLDILNIPIAKITQQYISYIEIMSVMRMELASEYLVMAALLAEIKSRMLLPRKQEEEENEEDPRAMLMRRLLEYEEIKKSAEQIDEFPRNERDTFMTEVCVASIEVQRKLPEVQLQEVLLAFQDILRRADQMSHHKITREPLSVRERMSTILDNLKKAEYLEFGALFTTQEGRHGVVVAFLAILELCKEGLVNISQQEPFTGIQVSATGS